MQISKANWLICCSSFADIFDVDHFLNTLMPDVNIVTELPQVFAWSTREYYATGYRATRVKNAPVQGSPEWYIANVVPLMRRYNHLLLQPAWFSFYFLVASACGVVFALMYPQVGCRHHSVNNMYVLHAFLNLRCLMCICVWQLWGGSHCPIFSQAGLQ